MKNFHHLQLALAGAAIASACASACLSGCTNAEAYTAPDAPIKEVPFTQVHFTDSFWAPRIETNRTVSIPSAFRECEKNGRFDNFAIAGGLKKGVTPRRFFIRRYRPLQGNRGCELFAGREI